MQRESQPVENIRGTARRIALSRLVRTVGSRIRPADERRGGGYARRHGQGADNGYQAGLSLRREAVAASVLDGRDIRLGGVDAIKDATALAPNFFIPDYGSRMTSSIYVRGLGTRIEQPVVGLNIDNVPIADKNMYDLDMSDIERIEILRGPQSTLYGRNTMCGVINVYTTSPLAYQGVRFNAEYGSRNHYRIASSAYNKFGEGLGLSVAGQFSHTDGYFRNLYDNSLCDKENMGSMRIKFQYRRNALSIDNLWRHSPFCRRAATPTLRRRAGASNTTTSLRTAA